MGKPEELSKVIGKNARRIRLDADATLDHMAAAVARFGLSWSTGRVGDLEAGRVAPTLPNLIGVAFGLGWLRRVPVALYELVEHPGPVQVASALSMDGSDLAQALNGIALGPGFSIELRESMSPDPMMDFAEAISQMKRLENKFGPSTWDEQLARATETSHLGLTETRVAKDLGVSIGVVAQTSWYMWRRSFSDERDHRAGPDASAQKRGQVTRQMKAELRAAIEGLDHGDD